MPNIKLTSDQKFAIEKAILSDCDNILIKYSAYPGSVHASNAQYLKNSMHSGEFRVQGWLQHIINSNYSIQGISQDEKMDGPVEYATCSILKATVESLGITTSSPQSH
jgi:hypothetical protein